MWTNFSTDNFREICDKLASEDDALQSVIARYGYPPMWTRPNSFETLVHIILEQQVSLASALSALKKLQEKLGDISPEKLLLLTDEELKACYFSRQKTSYVRHLAEAITSRRFGLLDMEDLTNEEVRSELIKLKGIGNWTADIYLMFALQRADIFPHGDLAAISALKEVKKLPKDSTKETMLEITGNWRPYRTLATMILWHYYLSKRKPVSM
ncbi:MAG: DNA-3-methyladenine glycosylase 2 family protein [Chitinophagaceae bacterium]